LYEECSIGATENRGAGGAGAVPACGRSRHDRRTVPRRRQRGCSV